MVEGSIIFEQTVYYMTELDAYNTQVLILYIPEVSVTLSNKNKGLPFI